MHKLTEVLKPYVAQLSKTALEDFLPAIHGIVASHRFEHMATCLVNRLKRITLAQLKRRDYTGDALLQQKSE